MHLRKKLISEKKWSHHRKEGKEDLDTNPSYDANPGDATMVPLVVIFLARAGAYSVPPIDTRRLTRSHLRPMDSRRPSLLMQAAASELTPPQQQQPKEKEEPEKRLRKLVKIFFAVFRLVLRRLRRSVRLLLFCFLLGSGVSVYRQAPKTAETVIVAKEVPFSQFVAKLKDGGISEVTVARQRYDFVSGDGDPYFTAPLPFHQMNDAVVEAALASGATVKAAPAIRPIGPLIGQITFIIYLCFVIGMFRQMSTGQGIGPGNNVGTTYKPPLPKKKKRRNPLMRLLFPSVKKQTNTTIVPQERPPGYVTFDDVAGINAEARVQVEDLRDLVANARKYAAVGARTPKGILLVGPPGTGKTLLARALANEAKVPFIYCSGSDFVEIFAGRGAARVRNLFTRASKFGKCIIFIDELDAVGRSRQGEVSFRASDTEQEQTLNQLLASMDGVQQTGIVVLGATNRLRILDPALVRPGRFDRIVRIEAPDTDGRDAILNVHAKHLTVDPNGPSKEVRFFLFFS